MPLLYEDLEIGQALPALTAGPLTHNQFVRYAGASGDFNPLHTDPAFARAAGLDGVIAHGMLVMGIAGRLLSDAFGPEALRRFGVRFKGMTRPGDTLTVTALVKEKLEVAGEARVRGEIQAADQSGEVKLAGVFEVAPRRRA
jgi:acyl dehydratase